jgi:hypothetical protein
VKFQAWLAGLPPQIRQSYESGSWDEVPPRWRTVLREWTKRMAEDDGRPR